MKVIRRALIIILLFLSFKVHALEFCTPSDEYLEYMKLSEQEKAQYLEPIRCKHFSREEKKKIQTPFDAVLKQEDLPSSYSSVSNGYVTSVKNQYDLGTCWAFASIAVVESNAKKNGVGNFDLSESHMIYSLISAAYSDAAGKRGKYSVSNFDGGKVTFGASYFFNGYGQLEEKYWPYVNEEIQITSSDYQQGKQMLSVDNYEIFNLENPGICSDDNIKNIKKKVYENGAVQALMYMDPELFRDTYNNYYISTTNNSTLPNHGVTIVGWDNSISKSHFSGATNDGAWIVKNSWGANWSQDGYFYISYDDHFVCKNNAAYYGVSTKKYDYTYKSADMVGLPEFQFDSTFYISAKFSKKSQIREQMQRVTIPVGDNATYYIYLSKNNSLTSTNDWQLLGSGYSDSYRLTSIDVDNIVLNDDYTIIAKYVVDRNKSSTMFSMCNTKSETANMDYSKGLNYYSVSGNNWYDMSSMKIGIQTVQCEPNIFVNTSDVDSDLSISSITVGSSITANLYMKNVDTNDISYNIIDSNNRDVTYKFTVTPNYSNNRIVIKSDGKTSGAFYLNLTYDGNVNSKRFELIESVTSLNNSLVKVSLPNIFVTIGNNYLMNYSYLINKLSIKNSAYSVLNNSGNTVSSSSYIGTNFKLKTNNNQYRIVVMGDVNGDGRITALDYIEVRKHIMGTRITDSGKLLASDMDNNSKITALDYIAIRKILMR